MNMATETVGVPNLDKARRHAEDAAYYGHREWADTITALVAYVEALESKVAFLREFLVSPPSGMPPMTEAEAWAVMTGEEDEDRPAKAATTPIERFVEALMVNTKQQLGADEWRALQAARNARVEAECEDDDDDCGWEYWGEYRSLKTAKKLAALGLFKERVNRDPQYSDPDEWLEYRITPRGLAMLRAETPKGDDE